MIATQARAFIAILRSHGARVAFVTPVPQTAADPAADNAIWHAYLPVLRAEHVTILDIRPALTDANGRRVEAETDCTGAPTLVRPPGDLHLTRYGASRSGTRLAAAIAALFGRTLHGAPAPGDHTTTLVATATGKGYWIVGCDGGVYAFGDARHIMSPALPAGVHVVGAARASRGLWLVTSDGRVLSTGGAPALHFGAGVGAPLVAAAGTADRRGILATTAQGQVIAGGTAVAAGGAERVGAPVVGIAANPAGAGYWLVGRNGTVVARGGARSYGSAGPFSSAPVAGITASTTGRGYLLVRVDGRVTALGDARAAGNAPHPPLEPGTLSVLAPTQPSVAIVHAPTRGYWIVDDNGAVRAFGGAPRLGGTGNLALFTP